MKILRVFRKTGAGERQKWEITLDEKMNVVDERPIADSKQEAAKADLTARGVEFTEKGKQILITKVPEKEQRAIAAIVDHTRCWFPGCLEIMKEYDEALLNLPADCPNCQKNAVIRKYRDRLLRADKEHKH